MYYDKNAQNIAIAKKVGGTTTILATSGTVTAPSTTAYHTYALEVNGSSLKAYLDGTLQATATDTAFTTGQAGLYTNNEATYFDNVDVH